MATAIRNQSWGNRPTPLAKAKKATGKWSSSWAWWYDCQARHQLRCNGKRGHLLTCRDEGQDVGTLDRLEAREGGS